MKIATGTTLIKNGQLIDCTGREPVLNAAVVIREGLDRRSSLVYEWSRDLFGGRHNGLESNPRYFAIRCVKHT